MLILQLFVSKLIVILYFGLMSYDYRPNAVRLQISCRTTIYSHVVRLSRAMSYDMRTYKHYSLILKIITLWFSASSFPRSYFQYSHKIRICSEIPKSQRGKCKRKSHTHGSIYIVRSCCSSKWRLCICFLKIGFTILEDLTQS